MSFDHWDEIRTAYQVARMGTVSGAADVLGVHHATVIRHIDALEGRLGAKLFQRHARGYTPTEAGLLVPAMGEFQERHPDLRVQLVTDTRLFRMEYGEAHVAIRAGKPGDSPDNIVQPFCTSSVGLYATQAYVDAHGRFIGSTIENSRAPFLRWLTEQVPAECIVFRANELDTFRHAVRANMGIGFISRAEVREEDALVEVLPPMEEWSTKLWLVTHMDLHRTAKVQTFLRFLKEKVQDWPVEPA